MKPRRAPQSGTKSTQVRRTTLTDIARVAKVSQSTVSLALRSHPKIPRTTRDKIMAIAKRMGYQPDPVLSALVAYRRGAKPSGNQETLAWINVWPEPAEFYRPFSSYWHGALERCQELGYNLEEFRLADVGMRAQRLSQVLRTRNIRGLLIPPQFRNRAHLNLEWEHFSAITFGYSLARPQLHVVTNAQFRSAVTAVRSLRRLGHRRIGLVLAHNLDERTDHNYVGGYLAEERRFRVVDRVPVFIMQEYGAKTRKKFFDWYEQYLPEAILTSDFLVEEWMRKAGYTEGKDYSLARLAIRDPNHGGIDQNEQMTGRTAVDLLVGMLHRSERGIPETPLRTLVEGRWVEGKTIRRLTPAGK